jgi:predicted thioesterase
MKAGLELGQTATVEFVVTPDMFAQFNGEVVHQLLSTSALVHQMEWAARQTILPYLEPDEEGMGTFVDVRHQMPTPVGVTVKLLAVVSEVRGSKVECQIEASHFRGKVASGVVVQKIVKKDWLRQKQNELEVVENIIEHDHGSEVTSQKGE